MTDIEGINPAVPPSGAGCVECDAVGGWWVHLRRCAECGHIGCCDTSPAQHATAHAGATGHPFIRSYEPGEILVLQLLGRADVRRTGPGAAGEPSLDQPTPGPAGRVPKDWMQHIH